MSGLRLPATELSPTASAWCNTILFSKSQSTGKNYCSDRPDDLSFIPAVAAQEKTQSCISTAARSAEVVRNVEEAELSDLTDSIRAIERLGLILKNPSTLSASPVRDQYLAAVIAHFKRDFPLALRNFIEAIRNDRYYDDDGSRLLTRWNPFSTFSAVTRMSLVCTVCVYCGARYDTLSCGCCGCPARRL